MSEFLSVWDAIEDDPGQAEVMKVRSALMREICDRLTGAGWDRVEAARRCGVTTPRLGELTGGKVDLFTMEELVRIASGAGLRVRIEVVSQE
jgi:predicted XRE-type DNA-binding protein